MIKVLVTGVTGKSGLFFYEELRKNVDKLGDYEFDFVVRDKAKAERLLDAKWLNQNLCVGTLADRGFIDSLFKMGGGRHTSSYCQYRVFGRVG